VASAGFTHRVTNLPLLSSRFSGISSLIETRVVERGCHHAVNHIDYSSQMRLL
jgi:hypothetical protein